MELDQLVHFKGYVFSLNSFIMHYCFRTYWLKRHYDYIGINLFHYFFLIFMFIKTLINILDHYKLSDQLYVQPLAYVRLAIFSLIIRVSTPKS